MSNGDDRSSEEEKARFEEAFWTEPLSGIADPAVRLFRQCVAMHAHAADKGLPLSPSAKPLLGLLQKRPSDLGGLPVEDLKTLHEALAEAVKPSLPATIELIAWERRKNPRCAAIAPVSAMRNLMICAAVFVVLAFGMTVSGFVEAKHLKEPFFGLVDEGASALQRLAQLLLFVGLAGMGACFSILHDAHRYVRDGTYDPAVGSNYIIRILLGLIAGLMLAQFLTEFPGGEQTEQAADPEDDAYGAINLVGKPLLAILGGFAAQFVYDALQRIVDGLRSIFQPSRLLETQIRLREQENTAERKRLNEQAERARRASELAARIQKTADGAEREALVNELVILAGFEAGEAPPEAVAVSVLRRRIERLQMERDAAVAEGDPGGRKDSLEATITALERALTAFGPPSADAA